MFVALLSVFGVATCYSCECTAPSMNFTSTARTRELTIVDQLTRVSQCASLKKTADRYPSLRLDEVPESNIAGTPWARGLNEQRMALLTEMLDRKGTSQEIMYMDTNWIHPVEKHLEPLAFDHSNVREKLKHFDRDGNLIAVKILADQMTIYYRKDLLDKYGLEYPDQSWEQFESVFKDVQTRERAAGNTDFWGLAMCTDVGAASRVTYMLATLLSGHDGGMIVEDDGRVSINNPGAVKTLEMWSRWVTDSANTFLAPMSYGSSTTATLNYFNTGAAAAVMIWTSKSDTVKKKNEQEAVNGWNIAAAPVPGPTGAGVAGGWSATLSKFTREKEAAMFMMSELAGASIDLTFSRTDNEPVDKRVLSDPVLWAKYCAMNPVLCDSYEKYPAFWNRTTHRPAGGCRHLYDGCTAIVLEGVDAIFKGKLSAAEGAAAMEKRLNLLLGNIQQEEYEGESEWTSTRTSLVVIAALCALVLIAIVVFVIRQRRGLAVNSCTIPVSFVLGFITVACFALTVALIVDDANETSRSITAEVSLKSRSYSLLSVKHIVEASLHGMLGEPQRRPQSHIAQQTIAKTKSELAKLQLDPRSLLLLVDRMQSKVLVSSDPSRQEAGVEFPLLGQGLEHTTLVHRWLREVLMKYPSLSTAIIDESEDIRLDGAFANVMTPRSTDEHILEFVEGVEFDETHGELAQFTWLLVLITPNEVVFEKTDKGLRSSSELSVQLSLLGCIAILLFSTALLVPLNRLSRRMISVSTLDITSIHCANSRSILSEVRILEDTFATMCRMLVEYKSYIPKACFEQDEEEAPLALSVASAASNSSSSSNGFEASKGSSMSSNKSSQGKKLLAVTVNLKSCSCAMMMLDFSDTGLVSKRTEVYLAMLSQIEQLLCGGTMHAPSLMSAGCVRVSWGLVSPCSLPHERGGKCALDLVKLHGRNEDGLNEGFFVSLIAGNKMKCGNLGTSNVRSFCLSGEALVAEHLVRKTASYLTHANNGAVVVCTGKLYDNSDNLRLTIVDLVVSENKMDPIYEINGLRTCEPEEWMYILEKKEQEVKSIEKLLMSIKQAPGSCSKILREDAHTVQEPPLHKWIVETLAQQIGDCDINIQKGAAEMTTLLHLSRQLTLVKRTDGNAVHAT